MIATHTQIGAIAAFSPAPPPAVIGAPHAKFTGAALAASKSFKFASQDEPLAPTKYQFSAKCVADASFGVIVIGSPEMLEVN